ncbi:peroxidasin-like, partial [Lingula anatina]|uniref:Peroxidasin-like n=1 Tax=Lingula anatina TaxID=7574 RepID=A0A2R2MMX8_LINAN
MLRLISTGVLVLTALCYATGPGLDYSAISAYLPVAQQRAVTYVQRLIESERKFAKESRGGRRGDPFAMVANIKGGDLKTKILDTSAKLQHQVYRELISKFNIPRGTVLKGLSTSFTPTFDGIGISPNVCPTETYSCDPYAKYRTINGSCNNLRNPGWGQSFKPMRRLLPANYGDGVSALRNAEDGRPLPSARVVSTLLHEDSSNPSALVTMSTMTFGQFLDHDMDQIPVAKIIKADDDGNAEVIDVECGTDGCDKGADELDACSPVFVHKGDPDNVDKPCFKFVRSSAAPRDNCEFGPQEQLNVITAYLDLSLVYGNTDEDAAKLRDDKDPARGKMKMKQHPLTRGLKPLLPQAAVKACRDTDDVIKCFMAGDKRLNEHIGLTAFHTLFTREHNRLEEELHKLNPHWGGETLYQEARRINIAQWQYIVYKEYLPVVIGPIMMDRYRLNPLKDGYYTGYKENVNAGISNVFATSAFRFGHSTIPTKHRRTDVYHNIIKDHEFSSVFRRPALVYKYEEGGIDSIVSGMLDQECENTDRFMTKQVTLHMFAENPPHGIGTDLAMLNNQRGRDHGIPGYKENVNAGISNVFATSAFRFGHSTIPTKHRRTDVYHNIIKDHEFSSVFRRPALVYKYEEGGIDSIVSGMLDQECENTDRFMTKQVTLHMFAENPPHGIGTDLAMLNNQRGRDHGIPGYNLWRELCGGNRAKTFEDFMSGPREFRINYESVEKLKMLYRHPDDVDSWAGGLVEENLPGATVGPTFACIIAEQFIRSRDGDRFWYENKQAGFTLKQLQSIKKTSFSRIITDNCDKVLTIQPKA